MCCRPSSINVRVSASTHKSVRACSKDARKAENATSRRACATHCSISFSAGHVLCEAPQSCSKARYHRLEGSSGLDFEEAHAPHVVLVVKVGHQVKLRCLQHAQTHQLRPRHGSQAGQLVLRQRLQVCAADHVAAQGHGLAVADLCCKEGCRKLLEEGSRDLQERSAQRACENEPNWETSQMCAECWRHVVSGSAACRKLLKKAPGTCRTGQHSWHSALCTSNAES